MSTRQKQTAPFYFHQYNWISCVCVRVYQYFFDRCLQFSVCCSRCNLKHHRITIEGITWMTCVFMCDKHTHTHSPIQSVGQRRQLPTMLFHHALFAITVTGRALASLSDFYEHTCRDYWDLWERRYEMWKLEGEREKETVRESKTLNVGGKKKKWWNIHQLFLTG